MSVLTTFRREIDEFMGQHPQSPLSPDQKALFSGLSYYPANPDLIVEVDVDRLAEDEPLVRMETSTGGTQLYRRWGTFTFEVDGAAATLTIYADARSQDLFLPFKDATNGAETYGAGRYLDSHRPGLAPAGGGRIRVDFNFAYNPYRAYSALYSCPLPPRENWLKVPIRAGEKDFDSK